jgi:DNA-binding GntR family transcriptional regulator
MAQVVRLRTTQARSEQDTAAGLAEQLRLLPDELLQQLPRGIRHAISKATHGLHRHARPDTEEGLWPGGFTMLSRVQTKAIWDAIRALDPDERPNHVRHAFDLVILNLRQDTGEVMLSRDELAKEIGCSPDHVSHVMSTLVRLGVITRERQRVEGMRGPGVVVYFVNPHVAWNGSLDVRKAEAAEAEAPMLHLLQGGAAR